MGPLNTSGTRPRDTRDQLRPEIRARDRAANGTQSSSNSPLAHQAHPNSRPDHGLRGDLQLPKQAFCPSDPRVPTPAGRDSNRVAGVPARGREIYAISYDARLELAIEGPTALLRSGNSPMAHQLRWTRGEVRACVVTSSFLSGRSVRCPRTVPPSQRETPIALPESRGRLILECVCRGVVVGGGRGRFGRGLRRSFLRPGTVVGVRRWSRSWSLRGRG